MPSWSLGSAFVFLAGLAPSLGMQTRKHLTALALVFVVVVARGGGGVVFQARNCHVRIVACVPG